MIRLSILILVLTGTLFVYAEESFSPYAISYEQGRLKAPPPYQSSIRLNLKKAKNCREIYFSRKDDTFSARLKSGKIIRSGSSIGALFNRLAKEHEETAIEFFFKPGVYHLDQPLKPGKNHVIQGASGVTFKPALNLTAAIVIDGKEGIFLSNFTIEGGGIGNCETAGILAVNNSSYISISKVRVADVGGCGILFKGSKSQFFLIEECEIRNTGRAGIAMFDGVRHSLITKNTVENTTTHGIIFANGGSFSEVSENYIKGAGIHPGGGFAHGVAFDAHGHLHKGEQNLIMNNKILNSRTGGIEVADGQDHMYIIGNYIEGSGREHQKREDQYGIYFGGALSQGYHCLIRGNTIKNSCWDGIRIASPNIERPHNKSPLPKEKYGPTTHVDIIDNIVSGSMRYGIELNWCRDVYVKGNRIDTSKVADMGIIGKRGKTINMPSADIYLKDNFFNSETKFVSDLFESLEDGMPVTIRNSI